MFRKKFRVCYLIIFSILLLAMPISGCKSSSKSEVSENAKKVIDMMMTCPNSELYNKDMFGYVGIGEEIPEEKQAKIDAAYDSAMKIWENEIGDCFSENCLKSFLNSEASYKYLREEKFMQVESIELLEKEDLYEKVKVHALVENEKQEIVVEFKYNANNLIWQVNLVE